MAKPVYEESDSDEILDESEVDTAEVEEGEEEAEGEEEEEAPKPKAKAKPKAKVTEEDEEEEEAPPKKKVSGVNKSKGKEKANVKTTKEKEKTHRGTAKASTKAVKTAKHKASRSRRAGWTIPFEEESLIGRAFKLAQKGISLKKLKQFVKDNEAQPWIISFLRKGDRNGATWRVEEENGMFKISGVKMPKSA